MPASTEIIAFLESRQALLTPCFEAGDVNQILEFYDKSLSFSDHGKTFFIRTNHLTTFLFEVLSGSIALTFFLIAVRYMV